MTNKKLGFGMLVMVLVFGMAVVGCDNGSTNDSTNDGNSNGSTTTTLSGTSWDHYDSSHGATETLAFSSTGNTVTLIDPWINFSGTYSVSGTNLTINFTSPFAVKYTGVIGETILTITTNEGETQVFNKKQ